MVRGTSEASPTSGDRRRIRAVFLDLGGTLMDFEDFSGWVDAAGCVGVEVGLEALAHAYRHWQELDPSGLSEQLWWKEVLDEAAGTVNPEPTVIRFVDRLRTLPRTSGEVFSDARWCLDALAREHRKLGVISNSRSVESIKEYMEQADILRYFELVVSSGTEGVAKPNPEIFRRAVERVGVPAGEAFYVGDLPNTDARAARAAGLHSVWLRRAGTGFGEDPPEITSLTELPGLVRRLEGRALKLDGPNGWL
ncbi:MAG: HAD family hydrolase [Thermoplasmata archaeon]